MDIHLLLLYGTRASKHRTRPQIALPTTTYSTMSSPNTQAALLAMKSAASAISTTNTIATTVSTRTTHLIHLGKDNYPVFVPTMPKLDDPTFKKGGAFAQLEEKALEVAKEVKVADVITMVSELLPIDCSTAL